MIQTKLKICAGHDGTPHEAYIYKNIKGKKYCKSCTSKLEGSNQPVFKVHVIKKVSNKQKKKNEEKKILVAEDMKFYLRVWKGRFMFEYQGMEMFHTMPKCECCGTHLPEPNMMNFHHILEKRNYPELRHTEWNIAIVCPQCHNRYETNPDTVPYLKQLRVERMNAYLGNKLKANIDERQRRIEEHSGGSDQDASESGDQCD